MYRVTYNGYSVEFFDNIDEVNKHIDSKIHKNLKIENEYVQRIDAFKVIQIYQYNTLYSEMFLIEKNRILAKLYTSYRILHITCRIC